MANKLTDEEFEDIFEILRVSLELTAFVVVIVSLALTYEVQGTTDEGKIQSLLTGIFYLQIASVVFGTVLIASAKIFIILKDDTVTQMRRLKRINTLQGRVDRMVPQLKKENKLKLEGAQLNQLKDVKERLKGLKERIQKELNEGEDKDLNKRIQAELSKVEIPNE